MTIQEAIDRIDSMKPNMFSDQQKVAWLSELDGVVWREVYMTHEDMPQGIVYEGYDQNTEPDVHLLVPFPYTNVYQHWLAAKIDDKNRDTNEYTKNMVQFNSAWDTFTDYWNRTHMPRQVVAQLRL